MTGADMVPALLSLGEGTREWLGRDLFGHVIDGTVVPSLDGSTRSIIDPATGESIGFAASGSAADVDRASRSARAAFADGRWRNLDPLDKERRLRRLSTLIDERRDRFAELDVLDAGFLRAYSGFITQHGIDGLDYYSGWPTKLTGSVPASSHGVTSYELREPIGVIGTIMSWNGPTATAANAIAVALSCGNSVVLKPAEQTPMSAVYVALLAIEAGIPPGVVNVVHGTGEVVGSALVDHPEIDAISFTGSLETGRIVHANASKRIKRTSLELGGKSPFIVFADAYVEAAVQAACQMAWGATGQVCTIGSRVLVHESILSHFTERLVELSRGLRMGSGLDPRTELGPLISADQLERVRRYVRLGREEGAEVALGGDRLASEGGFFHEPIIFTNVDNSMAIARDEIFGPVLGIMSFDDEEEAFATANDTEYGLAAGVWTADVGRAHRAVGALNVGTVWVNTFQLVSPAVSYGGVKQSGHGRNLGAASIDDFTQIKSVWMSHR